MYDVQVENTQRWRAWRSACEQGRDRAEVYDQYLHPDTRVGIERIAFEGRAEDALEGPAGHGRS